MPDWATVALTCPGVKQALEEQAGCKSNSGGSKGGSLPGSILTEVGTMLKDMLPAGVSAGAAGGGGSGSASASATGACDDIMDAVGGMEGSDADFCFELALKGDVRVGRLWELNKRAKKLPVNSRRPCTSSST